MTLDEIRTYCRNLKGSREDFPFGSETLVLKIGSRMFALIPLDAKDLSINLKGDPFLNEEWRTQFNAVKPGYHMNKAHWNTVDPNDDIPDEIVYRMIDHSYQLVFESLPKTEKMSILDRSI
jgi:predicted DNA-binding protein (MmcQ/YjbR family)